MSYKIIEKECKRFVIELGLRPGYKTSNESSTVADIKKWYLTWQENQLKNNQPNLAGIINETSFVCAFKDSNSIKAMHEPSVRIEGELTREYSPEIFEDNDKIKEIVFDLAETIGKQAKQERVHVKVNNEFYVLEK